jgi:hypothetical protein
MTKRKSVAVKTRATSASRPSKVLAAARLSSASDGSLYSVHPGVAMAERWRSELPAKTGRTLDKWLYLIKSDGPAAVAACREWLTRECRLSLPVAAWLAEKALRGPLHLADDSPAAYLHAAPIYVEQMYAGAKQRLRPVYDRLVELIRSLGEEVRVCPCQTSVPLFRSRLFADIKPATPRRIALGLALGEEPFTARLLDTGGRLKRQRITHKVFVCRLADIDLQVKRWLKQAYERDG